MDANIYPTAGNALTIVVTVLFGMIADRTGQNYGMIVAIQALMMLSNILLSVWYISKGALMFAFYLSYAGSAATPVLIVSFTPRNGTTKAWPRARVPANDFSQSWASRLNAGDPSLRPLLVATANVVSYAWVLWVPRKFKPGISQVLHANSKLTVSSCTVPDLRRTEIQVWVPNSDPLWGACHYQCYLEVVHVPYRGRE